MLALEERFMIRDLYRKGASISEIARRTGRDRKTIRQTVQAPDILSPQKSRQPKARKIDPYGSYLEQRMAEGVSSTEKSWPKAILARKARCVSLSMTDDLSASPWLACALRRLRESKDKWIGDTLGSSPTTDVAAGSMPSS